MTLVLQDTCIRQDWPYPTLKIKGGPRCKTLRNVERIWAFLMRHEATRHDMLLCVGGGSISDLGGFAASTFKRGIRFGIVPTTLLSMADASIGGKTGIDWQGFKNSVGTFHKPTKTIIDTRYLQTLPEREFLSGMAEVIKTGLLSSNEDFYATLRALEDGHISEELILRIRAIKSDIVRRDPREKNIRQWLNLGHTIGHALEEAGLQWGRPIPHGYAVMQGLVAELYLSVMKLNMDRQPLRLLTHLMIEHYGKVGYSCKDYDRLIAFMRQDKKNTNHTIRFVLLKGVGEPVLNCTAEEAEIREALDFLFTL